MEFISVFDVIGPNMIGPSSSHTAGAASIALLAKKLFPYPLKKAEFILYGSFAKTCLGHGTDKALLGGILGFRADDERIRESFKIAGEQGLAYSFRTDTVKKMEHPNTADIMLESTDNRQLSMRGQSVGGGKIRIVRINGIDVDFTGEYSTILVKQDDVPGIIAGLSSTLSKHQVNIAYMRMYREAKGELAYTVIEADEQIPNEIIEEMSRHEHIHSVMLLQET
ncbi:MAG TPA: L-serine ammonia-lyase, iron-sulfur-dependent subunit beta [Lachnospiraceae bacterium]|nr:L-serine ammonia-lyase, iron-sulfur-dependent subunit beta [Lachnospiraceae bacterium]